MNVLILGLELHTTFGLKCLFPATCEKSGGVGAGVGRKGGGGTVEGIKFHLLHRTLICNKDDETADVY